MWTLPTLLSTVVFKVKNELLTSSSRVNVDRWCYRCSEKKKKSLFFWVFLCIRSGLVWIKHNVRPCPFPSALCVLPFTKSLRYGKTFELKMACFEEDLDRATRQARLVLSVNDRKHLQRTCLRHLLSN